MEHPQTHRPTLEQTVLGRLGLIVSCLATLTGAVEQIGDGLRDAANSWYRGIERLTHIGAALERIEQGMASDREQAAQLAQVVDQLSQAQAAQGQVIGALSQAVTAVQGYVSTLVDNVTQLSANVASLNASLSEALQDDIEIQPQLDTIQQQNQAIQDGTAQLTTLRDALNAIATPPPAG